MNSCVGEGLILEGPGWKWETGWTGGGFITTGISEGGGGTPTG